MDFSSDCSREKVKGSCHKGGWVYSDIRQRREMEVHREVLGIGGLRMYGDCGTLGSSQ